MNVAKRPRFLFDLAEELTWLNEKTGPNVADRWYDALAATIQFIAKNPHVGHEPKDLSPPGIRSWRVRGFPRWLIFYTADSENNVVLYRVRSGTMNLVILKMES